MITFMWSHVYDNVYYYMYVYDTNMWSHMYMIQTYDHICVTRIWLQTYDHICVTRIWFSYIWSWFHIYSFNHIGDTHMIIYVTCIWFDGHKSYMCHVCIWWSYMILLSNHNVVSPCDESCMHIFIGDLIYNLFII